MPYRIKYIGKIYEYVEEMKWYLRDDMKCELSNSKKCLNDEVEIIEEDKKIQLLPIIDAWCEDIPERNQVRRKINEIIDKLNEMEKE